jgi:hypothetical protein
MWSKTKTFTTHSDALAYLASCFGQTIAAETFTGDGTTAAYTLSHTPATVFSVTINGTPTTAYTVSGTTLTLDSAPASSSVIYVSYGYKS